MARSVLVIFLALLCLLGAVHSGLRVRSAPDLAARAQTQLRERERIIALAQSLNLYWVVDSPNPETCRKVIVSDFPIPFERRVLLNVNRSEFERWQGTVAVYVGLARMWAANCDPENPERTVVWGDSFVYGDPELIARLQSAVP
jgi:hypothetical protein